MMEKLVALLNARKTMRKRLFCSIVELLDDSEGRQIRSKTMLCAPSMLSSKSGHSKRTGGGKHDINTV